jgi:endoglucanase
MNAYRLLSLISYIVLGAWLSLYARAQALPIGLDAANIPIRVNQMGYEPGSQKIAIFVNPQVGFNSAVSFNPGATFEVRRSSDNAVVFTGNTALQNNGNVDASSGDIVWWGDFSAFDTPGTYHIFANGQRSYDFQIRGGIYADLLKHSVRFFFYQRQGMPITEEFGGNWTHNGVHMNDVVATDYFNPGQNPKDVSGGWWDAGDNTKYVSFALAAVWNLLTAYEMFPEAFGDDWGIPESGNGLPDILDEVKYELDWVLRMQNPDGGVHQRVTNEGAGCDRMNDPSANQKPRYYTAVTSWATASAAAMFAHAARITEFDTVYPGYTQQLTAAAEQAWAWLEQHPNLTPASGRDDGGNNISCGANGGVADHPEVDLAFRVKAAAILFRLTGDAKYRDYFYAHRRPFRDWAPLDLADYKNEDWYAYWEYSQSAGADPIMVDILRQGLRNPLVSKNTNNYPWRIFDRPGAFWWGYNQNLSDAGSMNYLAIAIGADPAQDEQYMRNAADYVHYIMGRNPVNYCFLTNLGSKGGDANFGVENPVMYSFHKWWGEWDGTGTNRYDGWHSAYGPIPAVLVGGPNQYYWASTTPPAGQPPAKSFRDGNKNSQLEESWAITECGIYYQARWVFLLAGLAAHGAEPATRYTLTVNNGSGSGEYVEGFVVSINADTAPLGEQFAAWVGDVAYLSDPQAATTTLTMPAADIAVTANFQPAPPPPAELVVYRDEATLITGTWGEDLQQVTGGAFEGTQHYRWDYSLAGWWAGLGLNLDNWGAGPDYDVRPYDHLSIALNGPSQGGHQLSVRLLSTGGAEGPEVSIPQTQPYAHVQIPLVDLVGQSDLDLSRIREIRLSMGGADNASGTLFFDDITFASDSPQPQTPAEQWRQTWFAQVANTGDAADLADPDNDGIVNLLERALGGNPTVPGSAVLPTFHLLDVTGQDGGTFPALTWRQRSGGSGAIGGGYSIESLTYTLQSSTDLENWAIPANVEQVGSAVDVGDGYESVTARLTEALQPGTPVFLRLLVTSEE